MFANNRAPHTFPHSPRVLFLQLLLVALALHAAHVLHVVRVRRRGRRRGDHLLVDWRYGSRGGERPISAVLLSGLGLWKGAPRNRIRTHRARITAASSSYYNLRTPKQSACASPMRDSSPVRAPGFEISPPDCAFLAGLPRALVCAYVFGRIRWRPACDAMCCGGNRK